MNFAYYRKSEFSMEETLKRLRDSASKNNLNILGEVSLPNTNGTLVQVCAEDWVDDLLRSDKNMIGLMPCSILVIDDDGEVSIGSGNPAVLGGVTQNPDIRSLAAEAENIMRNLINEVSGAGELKVQNLKLYSTITCPYCNMEKKWLEDNNIEHEVIYVDQDQKAAEEMVKNTGQMGVPVTEVQYENDESEYIIGFNKVQLTKILKL